MVKFKKNFKKRFLYFFTTLISFLTLIIQQYFYAFNPEEFNKDPIKKHIHLGWRYEKGSFIGQ
ncbi:MAG: hypothetical protein U9532_03835 ['Conium maculatum' witches'-broom phytoplasma]|nr:hypothetical protein ['Conium maculatum' witches'-broom phytoplasma]